MKQMVRIAVLALGTVALSSAGNAAAVNVNYDPSQTRTVKQINPTVTFWQMGLKAAIKVIGTFSGGLVEVNTFGVGADPCGVAAGQFTLYGCGDTFSNPWVLENNDFATNGFLERIDIAILDGGFVFDVNNSLPLTPSSSVGQEFTLPGSQLDPSDVITATYSQQVALQGEAPLGDVWGYLSVDLLGITSQGGNGLRNSLQFIADTDPIPLPAALPMILGAVGGLAMLRRRRTIA